MLNLFLDDLDRLAVEDVENFLRIREPECERPSEGVLVDFKLDLPQTLGKAVAAMANTYGGIIFLGVKSEKEKHNIPVSLSGLHIGKEGDLKARLTDKIRSSVYPSPLFDIGVTSLDAEGRAIALIRVQEGRFPPYEFNQGATVEIPVRVQDTNRQATVKEIEGLLAKRERATKSPEDLVSEMQSRRNAYHKALLGAGVVPVARGQRVSVIPRTDLDVLIDSRQEEEFENRVRSLFSDAIDLESFRRGNLFSVYLKDVSHQKTWELWSSGALSFSTRFEPHGVYLGEIVEEFLRACALARNFLRDHNYMGYVALEHELLCGSSRIYSGFPQLGDRPAEGEIAARRAGLEIPHGKKHLQSDSARSAMEVSWADFDPPQKLVARILLEELREACGARIDFKQLCAATDNLATTLSL